MSDLKELLQRGIGSFEPRPGGLERTRRQRQLRERNKRLLAGAVAILIGGAGLGFAALAFRSSSASPGGETQSPAPSPPVGELGDAIVAMTSGPGIPALDGAEIVRIDPVSGGVTQLTHAGDEGRSAMSPAWSPDGHRIAFVMGDLHQPTALAGTYDIYMMGADGSGVQRVTQGINAQLPTWSPDGRSIAFVRDQGAAISVVDLATGSVSDVYVPEGHQIVQVPSWSPDGSRIAFQMGPDSVDIYTVDLATGDFTRFTDDGDSGYPVWSPDGSRIAFRRGSNIWVMSARGTGATRITACSLPCVDSFSPVWSPDGSRLAFVRQGHGGASLQLFEIGVDGSNLHQLTSGPTMYSNPAWRPGGQD